MAQTAAAQSVATYVSFDAGATWTSNGALPGGPGLFYVNATVAFDPQGRGYVSAVAGRGPNTQDVGALVWRTDDGGRTFHPPAAAFTGLADHPWLVASPGPRPAPAPLHVVWYGATGLGYTRSTDRAATFAPARTLIPQPLVGWPMAAAGPDGAVHVAYAGQAGVNGAASPLPLRVVNSRDYGTTFAAPVEVVRQTPPPPPRPGGPALGKSGPVIAASPHDSSVYLASVRYQAGAGHTDIMISSSRDQGRTWSTPIPATPRRPGDLLLTQTRHRRRGPPRDLHLRPDAAWHRRLPDRLAATPPRFSAPARLTSRPFAPALGVNRGGTYWFGDYQGLAASGGTFHAAWTDTRTGRMEIFTAAVWKTTPT